MSAGGGEYDSFFSAVDGQQAGVRTLVELRDKLVAKGSRAGTPKWSPEFVTNEFIPFMNDW
eukprot:COSAG06_NODE_224_length_19789_cov_2569.875622_3_plen_61_part_00